MAREVLTNAEMVALINSGQKITYKGRILRTIADVPSDEQILLDYPEYGYSRIEGNAKAMLGYQITGDLGEGVVPQFDNTLKKWVLTTVSGGGGGSTLAIKEVDGTPTLSAATTLEFDQSDGFVLSNPSGSIARLKLSDIPWSILSKTGSSLADLTTRSASDLSSGTLSDSRLSSNVTLAGSTIATDKLLGRDSAGTGAFEAIGLDGSLTFTGTQAIQLSGDSATPGNSKYYGTNGSGVKGFYDLPASGTGDVVGPASATDNAIARFDTTTGKLIQNSLTTLDDSGGIHAASTIFASSTGGIQFGDSGGVAGANRGFISPSSDGVFRFGDSGGVGSPHIVLGSVGASTGVRIKRSSTTLAVRNGDDTADASITALAANFTGPVTFAPTARTSGSLNYFLINTPADTGITTGTESIGAKFGGDSSAATVTRTWAAGALTTQRENLFVAPTYNFASASTLTNAVTLEAASPVAGVNATLTNSHAARFVASAAAHTPLVVKGAGSQSGDLFRAVNSSDGNLFRLDNSGNMYALTWFNRTATSTRIEFGNSAHNMSFIANGTTRLFVDTSGSVFVGNGDTATSPNAGVLQATGAANADSAGANLSVAGGISRGTGAGGSIIFQTSPAAGSTSSSQNALVTRLTIPSSGGMIIPELGSAPSTPSANTVHLYAADKSGVSALYFRRDDGSTVDLTATGGGSTNPTSTVIPFNNAGSFADTNLSFATNTLTQTRTSLGTTVTESFILTNSTAAAAGAQQISPGIVQEGRGWGTTGGTSQSVKFVQYVLPIQGTTPTGEYIIASSVNGGAFTTRAKIDSAGVIYSRNTYSFVDVPLSNINVTDGLTMNFVTNSVGRLSLSGNDVRIIQSSGMLMFNNSTEAIERKASGLLGVNNGTAIGTTVGNARDLMLRGLYCAETASDPSASDLTVAGSNTKDAFRVYMKNDKFVIAYNNSGTVTYITIPLDGSTNTWTHSTTAP